jgi:hypothetical protein
MSRIEAGKAMSRSAVLLALLALGSGPVLTQTTSVGRIPVAAPVGVAKQATSTIGVEVVYVTQFHSVQPKSIIRTAGPFLLIVENHTVLPTLNLKVTSVTPNAAAAAAGATQGKFLEFLLNLPVGKYAISESSRPDWTVDLEIQ